jgi:4'-phosphopantetheinyl transferase
MLLNLADDEVHICIAVLDLPIIGIKKLNQMLSSDERKRAERFHFEQDRKRFIVGVGILRTILGYYLSVEPGELRFCYGKHGKPRLADAFANGSIHFNMSHSDGLTLYGFTREREIGVDIERVRDIPEMDKIVEQFFSAKEKDFLRSLPESMKKEVFFDCWTKKEAFIKAIGDGLYQPLDKFDVAPIPGELTRPLRMGEDSKIASRWFIQDLKPAPGFAGAFAVEGGSCQLRFYQWSSKYKKKSKFKTNPSSKRVSIDLTKTTTFILLEEKSA